MKKKPSRDLVIDASVARASGGDEATHPTATLTRNFLQAVLEICHKAVMTPTIRDEWNRHQSKFARKWRSSMVARKKLKPLPLAERQDIRKRFELADIPYAQKKALLKDCHLIEAALATDRRIIALDDAARKLFSAASFHTLDIQDILWLNPVTDPEQVIAWLEGAPDRAQWQLGQGDLD